MAEHSRCRQLSATRSFTRSAILRLHNIGTGDGIVQNAGQATANQIRTPPLWGIRARNRLMHEGLNVTIFDSIQLHAGQATTARNNFNALTPRSGTISLHSCCRYDLLAAAELTRHYPEARRRTPSGELRFRKNIEKGSRGTKS